MKQIPYIVGIGELQRKAASVIEKIDSQGGEGFVVSHNEPKAVLMSLKRYERLKALEEAKRLEEDEVLTIVAKGNQEYETGQTTKVKSLKALL